MFVHWLDILSSGRSLEDGWLHMLGAPITEMKPWHFTTIAFIVLVTCTAASAERVIFFPPPGTSYIAYHTNVAQELVLLGHQVWICVPAYLRSKNLVKNPAVNVLEYAENLGNLETRLLGGSRILDKFWANEAQNDLIDLFWISRLVAQVGEEVLSEASFLDQIRDIKPNLFVLESMVFNMNMVVIPYMMDVPFALIGTIHDVVLSKVPFSPATTPFPIDKISDRMSFMERVKSTIFYLLRINFDIFYDSSLVSKFAPLKPYKSINEIAAGAEIFIAEVDHILDYPRATLPNTKLIGGSSASPAKPLVGQFKKFVDESKNGIIVMSFGGTVVDIPPHITSKMISAFNQLDLNIVWKVNISSSNPDKILASKWIPQNDLLGHEKTKLFISHCGKNGQYEALYHGVPILCLPMFGDQNYNSERVVVKELGLKADMREVSPQELVSLIKQLVYEKKYTQNMQRASRLYRELYKVPKKEAAYWLDHVIQHGGQHLRSAGQEMSWFQLYVLDVISFFVGVIFGFFLFIRYLLRLCCGSKKLKRD